MSSRFSTTDESRASSVREDIARLQEQFRSLEKTMETLELTLRTESNLKDLKTKEDLKGLKVTLGQVVKRISSLETRVARYAGGAGVVTAIAIKILDRMIHF